MEGKETKKEVEKKYGKKLVKTSKEIADKKNTEEIGKKVLNSNKENKKVEEVKTEENKKVEEVKTEENKKVEEVKTEENKKEVSLKKKEKIRPKKSEVIVRAQNIPLSTKSSSAICKFIIGKKIGDAIMDLESVKKLKKAVPMKGEIPHRKGNIMSGRYPQKTSRNFIVLLKSLSANANFNDMEEPIIVEAFANIGERPYGQFGRIRKKRSHIFIKAIEKNTLKNKHKKAKNK